MIPERIKRVEREIQRALADILRDAKDPRLATVTVTAVKVSPDLRSGRVFVSSYKEAELPAILTALQGAAGHLGRQLGAELDLRRTPSLTFELDPSLAQGARIDALLQSLRPAESGPQED